MNKKSNAAVLVVTLMFIAIISALTIQFVRHMSVHAHFTKNIIDKASAKLLCRGGVNLAIANLTKHVHDEGKSTLLSNVLPHLNKWQAFKLTKDVDGMDGEVKFCITSEDGKFNINEIFDFKQGKFLLELQPYLDNLTLGGVKKLRRGEVRSRIAEFLKKRGRKLDDISELLEVEGLGEANLFYSPPKKDVVDQFITLGDLFTVNTSNKTIEPWFFSDSVCRLLGLRTPKFNDADTRRDVFKQVIDKFNAGLGSNWAANWSVLMPLYEKQPSGLFAPDGKTNILSQQFDPKVYTVISCGKVGGVEQKLIALIEKKGESQNLYNIIKSYWL